MDAGDFVGALDACERALAIEPDNTAARDLEARARAAIQMQTWLANAHGEFERGALTAAGDLVELVLGVNESHPDALSLRQKIEVVRRSIARERRIDAALTRAHARLEAGALEEAAGAVAELLDSTRDSRRRRYSGSASSRDASAPRRSASGSTPRGVSRSSRPNIAGRKRRRPARRSLKLP